MDKKPPSWGHGHQSSLSYHARMLGDVSRMDAYERAIRRLVKPGDVVLDLGSGTGIFGMWAARRGARRVYAVESAPVAGLAEELVSANGLEGIVQLIRGDATTLPAIEPVDLVLSDFMGRFVVDDGMLWAVDAARKWLKPGGRFCPCEVVLYLAPVAIGFFAPLDIWERPVSGLDVSAARKYAQNYDYGADLSVEALLAPALPFHSIRPPDTLASIDYTLHFELQAGPLRGLLGWFEAELADGITLSTGPGNRTHWDQYLLPLPRFEAQSGDILQVHLRFDDSATEDRYLWKWAGFVSRHGERVLEFSLETRQALGERIRMGATDDASVKIPSSAGNVPLHASRERILQLNEAGTAAFEAGDYASAIRIFGDVTVLLGLQDDDLAPDLWENLGLAHIFAGEPVPAIPALLRALDGDVVSREQAARFLINAYFQVGWNQDGTQALEAYQNRFGPHPAGWRIDTVGRPCLEPE